jgi:hypothetical protein
MPLLDHFHAPLHPTRSWESFHGRWAYALSDALNGMLPERYLAEGLVHIGTRVAADVAEFDLARVPPEQGNGPAEGVAVQTWAPPAAAQTVTMRFPDDIEVHVYDLHRDRRLVAVIELISPSNKDDAAARRTFAGKCAACLQRGIGLIMVDVVTSRGGNLHAELLDLLGQGAAPAPPAQADLYAAAYRPAQCGEESQLDIWPAALAVGQPLPLLPLALRAAFFVPVDLEATYTEARQRSRL